MAAMTVPEALTLALTLAVTAPDEDHAAECVRIAEQLAVGLTAAQVEACKTEALQQTAGA